jgi:hypothetical protein
MKIIVDNDVAKIVEFMEMHIPREKVRCVSLALVQMVDLLWAHCDQISPESFRPFQIYREEGPHIIDYGAAESPQLLDGTQASQKDSLASAAGASPDRGPRTSA